MPGPLKVATVVALVLVAVMAGALVLGWAAIVSAPGVGEVL